MGLPAEILQGILARAALVLLRIYLGVVFLVAAVSQIRGDGPTPAIAFTRDAALEQGHLFYRGFLRTVVLPNADLFTRLVPWAAMGIGVLLVLGLFTRVAAASAMLLTMNCMFAKGEWFWTRSSSDAAYSLIALALLLAAAGRTLGLDRLLARRRPRSALW
jgi:thiosulfate dehydrogenase [quinone] large subunit